MLALRGDAVHVVVAHCQCVACRFAVCTRVGSGCACQTIECVVGVAVAHLSACLAALWQGCSVCHAQHVAYYVIRVGVVHDGIASGIHFHVLQSATLRVVGVECLRSVAVLHVRALAEFVISYAVHIVISVRLVSVYVRKLSAQVICVGHFLFVRVDHLQQSVVAVVGPLGHIGGDGLVRHDHRASGLGHFAHLAVEVFYGTCSVLTEHQPADAVL